VLHPTPPTTQQIANKTRKIFSRLLLMQLL
jgi:hypothetical protein